MISQIRDTWIFDTKIWEGGLLCGGGRFRIPKLFNISSKMVQTRGGWSQIPHPSFGTLSQVCCAKWQDGILISRIDTYALLVADHIAILARHFVSSFVCRLSTLLENSLLLLCDHILCLIVVVCGLTSSLNLLLQLVHPFLFDWPLVLLNLPSEFVSEAPGLDDCCCHSYASFTTPTLVIIIVLLFSNRYLITAYLRTFSHLYVQFCWDFLIIGNIVENSLYSVWCLLSV